MRNTLPLVAASVGMALSSCSVSGENSDLSEGVERGYERIDDAYNCTLPPVKEVVSIGDTTLSDEVLAGQGAVSLAYARDGKIVISEEANDNPDLAEFVSAHEALHLCTDHATSKTLKNPYEIFPGTKVTHIQGFSVGFDGMIPGTDMQGYTNADIEEGVVEYLRYKVMTETGAGSDRYILASILTEAIVEIAGLNTESVVDMLKHDNLEGFTAAAHNIDSAEVNECHVLNMLDIYATAVVDQQIPQDIDELRYRLDEPFC